MDEAWRLIQHPALRAYVQEALKTWRKRNAAVLLATQAIDDFASVDLLRTGVESCPTRLLLANPSMDRRQCAELFQLNEMELELLAGIAPRQQLLLKRPNVAKVLTLRVDPKSYQRRKIKVGCIRLEGAEGSDLPRVGREVQTSVHGAKASAMARPADSGARAAGLWVSKDRSSDTE